MDPCLVGLSIHTGATTRRLSLFDQAAHRQSRYCDKGGRSLGFNTAHAYLAGLDRRSNAAERVLARCNRLDTHSSVGIHSGLREGVDTQESAELDCLSTNRPVPCLPAPGPHGGRQSTACVPGEWRKPVAKLHNADCHVRDVDIVQRLVAIHFTYQHLPRILRGVPLRPPLSQLVEADHCRPTMGCLLRRDANEQRGRGGGAIVRLGRALQLGVSSAAHEAAHRASNRNAKAESCETARKQPGTPGLWHNYGVDGLAISSRTGDPGRPGPFLYGFNGSGDYAVPLGNIDRFSLSSLPGEPVQVFTVEVAHRRTSPANTDTQAIGTWYRFPRRYFLLPWKQ